MTTCPTFGVLASVAFCLLISHGAHALVPPELISPGTTNAPGPAIEDSSVTFRWLTVEGATSHVLSIRDLTTGQLEVHEVTAPDARVVVTLTGDHEFRWNMRALSGTNHSGYSESLHFRVNPAAVRPTISDVAPNPAPALDGGQPFVIYGDDFLLGCTVVLRDEQSGQEFGAFRVTVRQVGLINITPNFTHAEGPWSVEVINPGGFRSGRFYFEAVSPERIRRWRWWRSGWPWATAAGGLFVCGLAGWIGWRPKLLAKARTTGARHERARILQDLHDGVSGELAQIGQLVDTVRLQADSGEPTGTLRKPLESIRAKTRSMADSIDDLLWAAKPSNERLPALVGQLRERINTRLQSTGIERRIEFPVPVPELTVAGATSHHLLQLTNEVLNNVVKHAGAKTFTAGLKLERGLLYLTLGDDGCGFVPDSTGNGRHGLANLQKRAKAVGGVVEIVSGLSVGTEVQICLPLKPPTLPKSEITL